MKSKHLEVFALIQKKTRKKKDKQTERERKNRGSKAAIDRLSEMLQLLDIFILCYIFHKYKIAIMCNQSVAIKLLKVMACPQIKVNY